MCTELESRESEHVQNVEDERAAARRMQKEVRKSTPSFLLDVILRALGS